MQLLSAKFAQINAEINATNAQIAALQAKLSELQEFQQQLLSVEQACESACLQVQTALMMLYHVDPSQVGTFKDAVATLFDSEPIGVLEPAAPTSPEPAPESTAPITPDAPPEPETAAPIDVQAVAEPEATPSTTPEPAPDMDIEQALANMPLPSLRVLAKSKGTDARGSKVNLAARLKKLVTPADLRAAS